MGADAIQHIRSGFRNGLHRRGGGHSHNGNDRIAARRLGRDNQRIITRRLTTLQRLTTQERDRDVIAARRHFNEPSKPDGKLSHCTAPSDLDQDETNTWRLILNDHELRAELDNPPICYEFENPAHWVQGYQRPKRRIWTRLFF